MGRRRGRKGRSEDQKEEKGKKSAKECYIGIPMLHHPIYIYGLFLFLALTFFSSTFTIYFLPSEYCDASFVIFFFSASFRKELYCCKSRVTLTFTFLIRERR
jgi:hypothetical protein